MQENEKTACTPGEPAFPHRPASLTDPTFLPSELHRLERASCWTWETDIATRALKNAY